MKSLPRGRSLWVGAGILLLLSFGASAFMLLLGGDLYEPRSAGPDLYSYSLLGHRAFRELLDRAGIPARVTRDPGDLVGYRESVGWIAEPSPGLLYQNPGLQLRRRMELEERAPTVVVLPEWRGLVDAERPRWIRDRIPIADTRVDAILEDLQVDARVVRPSWIRSDWDSPWPDLVPELQEPQLLRGDGLQAVLSCEEGMLVAWAAGPSAPLLLISDPELISNGGLGRGDNAALLLAVAEMLPRNGHPLLLDASLQGFEHVRSLAAELSRFPLSLVTAQALLLAVVALLSAVGRFGRPLPESDRPAPGHRELIDNTVRLLASGGHVGYLGHRYARRVVESVGARLHAPHPTDTVATVEWLERLEENRTPRRARELLRRATGLRSKGGEATRDVLHTARELDHWRREMLRGTRSSAGPRR